MTKNIESNDLKFCEFLPAGIFYIRNFYNNWTSFVNFTAIYSILDFLHKTPNFSAQLCSVRKSENYDPIDV